MSILAEIVRHKRQELAGIKAAQPRMALEAQCRGLAAPRDFERALTPMRGGVRLIAEVKKASPSKGLIRADFHAGHLAHELEEGGARLRASPTWRRARSTASSSSGERASRSFPW